MIEISRKKSVIALAIIVLAVTAGGISFLSEDSEGAPTVAYDPSTATLTISGSGSVSQSTVSAYLNTAAKVVITGEISGIGAQAFYYSTVSEVEIDAPVASISSNAFQYCSNLTKVTLPPTLVSIGNTAFVGCSSLSAVTIPSSVTSIGTDAFMDCTGLADVQFIDPKITTLTGSFRYSGITSFTIPDSVTSASFEYCENLKTVTFGTGITSISENMFEGCTALESVVIPDGVTSIGNYAFAYCSALSTVTIPSSVTAIGDAFLGCTALAEIDLPSGLTSLGEYAFQNCTSLTSVTIPSGITTLQGFNGCTGLSEIIYDETKITSIGNSAFAGTKIASFTIPSGVTALGNSTFQNCLSLTSVDLANVTEIGNSTFAGCTSLASMDLRNVNAMGMRTFQNCTALEEITGGVMAVMGNYTFMGCTALEEYTMPGTVTTTGQYIFQNSAVADLTLPSGLVTISPNAFRSAAFVTVDLPDSVETIGADAFMGCVNLTSIIIPEKVTTVIGFRGCTALASVTYANPDNITAVGDYAFAETSLVSIEFPSTVTTIGQYAFQNCTGLMSVTMDGVITIGNYAFSGCTAMESFVMPSGVTTLGSYTFQNCTSLTDADLGDLVNLGTYTFYGCIALASITLPDTLTAVGAYAFSGCAALTGIELNNVTELGNYAFQNCTNLADIDTGGVRTFGTGVFAGCPNITSFAFSEGIETIPAVLRDNTYLISVTIPASAKEIGDNAFYGCTSLRAVMFADGSSLTAVGAYAFYNCSSLWDIELPEGVTKLGNGAFSGTGLSEFDIGSISDIGTGLFRNCLFLSSVTFDDDTELAAIPDNMFDGCRLLEMIEIPDSVTSIKQYAFNKSGVANVIFGEDSGLEIIEWHAFSYCTALEYIDLPDTLKSIGVYSLYGWNYYGGAFDNSGLRSIHIPDSVTTITNYSFSYCENLTEVTGGAGIAAFYDYLGGHMPSWYSPFDSCPNLAVMGMSDSPIFVIRDNVMYLRTSAFKNGESVKELAVWCVPAKSGGTVTIQDEILVDGQMLKVTSYYDNNLFRYLEADKLVLSKNAPVAPDGANYMTISELVIPDGVVSIGDPNVSGNNTFSHCPNLRTVVLPSTLTLIIGAFNDVPLEGKIVIPDGVTRVDGFNGCPNVTEIVLGEMTTEVGGFGGTQITSIDLKHVSSMYMAFNGNTLLKDIKFGIYTEYMRDSFLNCTALETVTIDGTDLMIYDSFRGCTNLKDVHLGEGVVGIYAVSGSGTYPFAGCPYLTAITVDPANSNMMAYEGMIFSASFTEIFYISPLKTELVIPDNVTKMPEIYEKNNLVSLKLGKNITEAYISGFPNLRELDLGGVTVVDDSYSVISNLPSLEKITMSDDMTVFMPRLADSVSLKSITLGRSLQHFDGLASSWITDVNIHPDNQFLKFDEATGVLYSADGTYVDHIATDTLRIPESVVRIARYIGEYNYSINDGRIPIKTLILGNRVGSLASMGINSGSVSVIVVGTGVHTIESQAFPSSVTDVYFLGAKPMFVEDESFDTYPAGSEVKNIHSSIEGEFLSSSGFDLKYDSSMGRTVTLNASAGVSVDESPIPLVQDGGTFSFIVSAERGYVIGVTATGGTLTDDGKDLYTISDVTGDVVITVTAGATDIDIISLSVDRPSAVLAVNDTLTLVATVNPSDATHGNITWSSGNASVASVDANGAVTAIGTGTAYITASVPGGIAVTIRITVLARVIQAESITLNASEMTLTVGDKEYLTATVTPSSVSDKRVIWTSNAPNIAQVDKNGRVIGIGLGSTLITASLPDGSLAAQCVVTVDRATAAAVATSEAESIEIVTGSFRMAFGEKMSIFALVGPYTNNTAVRWSIEGNAVLGNHASGSAAYGSYGIYFMTLEAVRTGTATITVTTDNGLSDSITVEVEKIRVVATDEPLGGDAPIYEKILIRTSYFEDGSKNVFKQYGTGQNNIGFEVYLYNADGSGIRYYDLSESHGYADDTYRTGYGIFNAEGEVVQGKGRITHSVGAGTYTTSEVTDFTIADGVTEAVMDLGLAGRDTYGGGVAESAIDDRELTTLVDSLERIESYLGTEVGSVNIEIDGTVSGLRGPSVAIVSMTGAGLKMLKERGSSVTFCTDLGSFTFSSADLALIADPERDDDIVRFTVSAVDITTLTAEQRSKLGDRPVFDMTVSVENVLVTGFDKVRVVLPYALQSGEDASKIQVWYLNGSEMTVMDCVYDDETKTVSFETDHFSQYAIAYAGTVPVDPVDPTEGEDDPEPSDTGGSGGNAMIYAGVGIAAVLGVLALLFVVRRK